MDQLPQAPTPFPKIKPPHRHFFNTKFLVTLVALIVLGGVAYAGMQWYINQPLPETSPTPSASADPTAGWKTYTSTKYGFEIKYPETLGFQEFGELNPGEVLWYGKQDSAFNIFTDEPGSGASSGMLIQIMVDQAKPSGTDLLSYLNSNERVRVQNGIEHQNLITTNFAGLPAVKVVYTGQATQQDYFIEKSPTKFVSLSVSIDASDIKMDEYIKTANQILSTFKFMDTVAGQGCTMRSGCPFGYACIHSSTDDPDGGTCQQEAVTNYSPTPTAKPKVSISPTPVSNFKTYNNAKFGISFTYPKELIVVENPWGDRSGIGLALEIEVFRQGDPSSIYVFSVVSNVNMGQMLDGLEGYPVTTIFMGGREGKRGVINSSEFVQFVPYNGGVFNARTFIGEDTTYKSILSSVKFTK